ncbi:hypothetical protein CYLTODRAFT_213369 [Cylindrobasidium torrendii FP15055 ss-10]|uniref:Fungal-type protein kinase domain-containing protein n=1 Tax=Cylindrobasidium torrendii FP15055 ss-10 TaxID=1314674 RepID=A0A0D7AWC2_9AGAR|nr:hypothetical protein CYLTODRAFT_213369 [Cylindrobasidium torrendii FP15055 ss-10]
MHRDISVGGLLRLVNFEVEDRMPFSAMMSPIAPRRTSKHTAQTAMEGFRTRRSIAAGNAERERLVVDGKSVLESAFDTQTGIPNYAYRTMWTDADMVVNMSEQGPPENNYLGTQEFQSWEMRDAVERKKPYAHSPLDDLHSFFWETLWAIMNNKNRVPDNDREAIWRRKLGGDRSERASVIEEYYYTYMEEEASNHSPMLVKMQSFMAAWKVKTHVLLREGHAKAAKLSQNAETTGHDILDMYKRLTFRGVTDYFELVFEHKESLGLCI